MKRLVGIPAVVVLLVALLASASIVYAGNMIYSPEHGSENTWFKFTGYGFQPGQSLEAGCIAPDGTLFAFPTPDGSGLVRSDRFGAFEITMLPSTDLVGGSFGEWNCIFYDRVLGERLIATIYIHEDDEVEGEEHVH